MSDQSPAASIVHDLKFFCAWESTLDPTPRMKTWRHGKKHEAIIDAPNARRAMVKIWIYYPGAAVDVQPVDAVLEKTLLAQAKRYPGIETLLT